MRSCILLALCTVACSAGAGRDSANGSASIGESTGGGMTGPATNWTSGDSTSGSASDASASADATSTGMATTVSTTDDPSTDESTGGPTSCADDPAACEAWFLPRDAASWQAVMLGGPAALAPSSPVLAAFDIEAEQIGFVITATELIRVDLAQRTWVSKTQLGDTLPDLDADTGVRGAWSIPAYWDTAGQEGVAITGDDVAFIYAYDASTDAFDFQEATAFGAEWGTKNAPVPSAMRDLWVDLTNDDGWVTNALDEVCAGVPGSVGPHIVVITDTSVHIDEAGTCFEFFDPVPYAQFAPFGLAGAPQAERIGGALYSETVGVVVFAGD